jgi:hypothetical protein
MLPVHVTSAMLCCLSGHDVCGHLHTALCQWVRGSTLPWQSTENSPSLPVASFLGSCASFSATPQPATCRKDSGPAVMH